MAEKIDMRRGDGEPVPWPVWTGKHRLNVPTEVFDALVEDAPMRTVKLAELVATQPTLDAHEAKNFSDGEIAVPKGKRNPRGLLIDKPLVFRRDGEDRIYDGHHRLAGAMERGETTAEVRYVDLDAARESVGVSQWARARRSRD